MTKLQWRIVIVNKCIQAEEKLYFDNVLELVTVVDPLAVPRSLITDKHFDLTTNLEGKLLQEHHSFSWTLLLILSTD